MYALALEPLLKLFWENDFAMIIYFSKLVQKCFYFVFRENLP